MTNITSEHNGVVFNHYTKEIKTKPQLDVIRSYVEVNYGNLIELLDENKNTKIQEMFKLELYRPINNMHVVEKIVKQARNN